MAEIDPAAFLWPAFLHDTSRRASRAWLKFERTLEEKGNWPDALAGVEMKSVLDTSEMICICPPDDKDVLWQPYVVGDPDASGVGRTRYIEMEMRKQLTVEGFDYLWFVLGQFSLSWHQHDWPATIYRELFYKAVRLIPYILVIEDRLVSIALGRHYNLGASEYFWRHLGGMATISFPHVAGSSPKVAIKTLNQLVEYRFIAPDDNGGYRVIAEPEQDAGVPEDEAFP